eukprot:CAMPEP_0117512978 /NCGR_PEP_ID=MMETSP0784-20121206/29313_1 /TAXON_ID=39447 /ORGANISM="" /LENGTH=817 /DNA_ID=CAMNT_0005308721 /DNA_START=157 /DNA_END=2606 /DNA_ORIENTATION=+
MATNDMAQVSAFTSNNAIVNAALSAALQQLDENMQDGGLQGSPAEPGCAGAGGHQSTGYDPDNDPVLAALRRYRDAAGTSYLPRDSAEGHGVEERGIEEYPDLVDRLDGDETELPLRPRPFGSAFSVESEVEHVICGFSLYDLKSVVPSWLEWLNPFMDESAADLCGVSRGPGSAPGSGIWEQPASSAIENDYAHLQYRSPQPDFSSEQGVPCSFQGAQPPGHGAGAHDCRLEDPQQRRPAQPHPLHRASPLQAISPATTLPAAPSMHVGPLGVPMPARTRQASMEAIRELPFHLNSATYDEDLDHRERDEHISQAVAGAGAEMPDPLTHGLQVEGDFLASPWGLGRIARGYVGCPGRSLARGKALVTEVVLPKALDTSRLKRLNVELRATALSLTRADISRPLGAVPATLPHGNAGVWVAWSVPEGGNFKPLGEALSVEPPRGPKWRMGVARQICSAMVALHGAGKSHGNLAPRNILVGPQGDVYILETGLIDAMIRVGVLHEHDLLAYMGLEFARYLAPEGWQVPRRAGLAADVWALGLVLLQVLGVADRPNSECTSMQQLSAKMLPKRGQYTPLMNQNGPSGALPPLVHQTLEACFKASPEARPGALQVLFGLAAPGNVEAAASGEVPQLAPRSREASAEAPGLTDETDAAGATPPLVASPASVEAPVAVDTMPAPPLVASPASVEAPMGVETVPAPHSADADAIPNRASTPQPGADMGLPSSVDTSDEAHWEPPAAPPAPPPRREFVTPTTTREKSWPMEAPEHCMTSELAATHFGSLAPVTRDRSWPSVGQPRNLPEARGPRRSAPPPPPAA